MINIAIRPFELSRYDDVIALWKRCEGVVLRDADTREALTVYLERNPGLSFVAVAGDQIVGAILGGHDGRRGYIHHLAVDAGCRRQGIAHKLVETCLQGLKCAGIRKTHIFIFAENEDGKAFWKSQGWLDRMELRVMSVNM